MKKNNAEVLEFISILIQSLPNKRYIEDFRFRIGKYDESTAADSMTYFFFDREHALLIFKILQETSHYCILKNLTVTTQIQASKEKKTFQEEQSIENNASIAMGL